MGGCKRDRTADPVLAKHVLSQLSYAPATPQRRVVLKADVVGLGRLELPTPCLSGTYSNQLSYRPKSSLAPSKDTEVPLARSLKDW